jgi:hypothetical protein
MHAQAFLVALLASFAAAAGTARVELEIDNDTFIQSNVAVPGTLNRNTNLVSARIAKVSGVNNQNGVTCQAFNGNRAVGGAFTLNKRVKFNNVRISKITCSN